MTNLEAKFAAFELQSANQHTELMNALNTIAYALGAPPTTPTVTLEDIGTLLTTINTNITSARSADATFHTSMFSLTSAINTNTDTIINNNSLNAQRLIAAIYATFCDCETDTPLLEQPLDVTPTSLVDEAKCRRIQFYLSVFGNWLDKIANYGNAGAAITGGAIATLLAVAAADAGIVAVGVEVGAAGGPPGMIIGAVVGLIAVAILTLGGAEIVDYANQFNDPTLRDNMVQAMYAATNADEGYEAFNSVLLATMETIPAQIIKTLWWSAWSNDVYSGSPVVDDSAFDGTICAPPPTESDCITVHIYTDTGTYSYEAGGQTYGRLSSQAQPFYDRIQGTTTIFSAMALTCSVGGFVYFLSANTLMTWAEIATHMGTPGGPSFLDSQIPTAGFTIEFCNLLGEEV